MSRTTLGLRHTGQTDRRLSGWPVFVCVCRRISQEMFDCVYQVDLFTDEGAPARRALAGEPVLILPLGTFYRNGQTRTVDAAAAAEFVENFAQRQSRGIRRSRLAVDIDHQGGAVGWYNDVVLLPDGVGATFAWTKRGQAALEAGEYAYFSPTVYWELTDRVTGQAVRHQLAGGALTNYPFFGEQTALYAASHAPGLWAWAALDKGGSSMHDERQEQEGARFAQGLREFFASLGGGAAAGAGGDAAAEVDALREQFATVKTEMATLTAQLTELAGERDAYKQRFEALQGELGQVQTARAVERFTALVGQELAHLPVKLDALAAELRWLHAADQADGQPHAQFFTDLLRQADAHFAAAFQAVGSGRGAPAGAVGQIEAAVARFRQEHAGATYADALAAVFQAEPALYAQYNAEVVGGGR